MSVNATMKYQFTTELELFKVAAGTFDPYPTLLGLSIFGLASFTIRFETAQLGRPFIDKFKITQRQKLSDRWPNFGDISNGL